MDPKIYFFAVETALALAAARLAAFLPFRWLMTRECAVVSPPALDDAAPRDLDALAVRRMIARVARVLPWTSNCLTEALAARFLLRRRGVASVMHFGVKRRDGRLVAHAWLEAGDGVELFG